MFFYIHISKSEKSKDFQELKTAVQIMDENQWNHLRRKSEFHKQSELLTILKTFSNLKNPVGYTLVKNFLIFL